MCSCSYLNFLSLFSLFTITPAVLEGPNVCSRMESYTHTVRVSEQQPYQVREYVWCPNLPPRCSNYKTKVKAVYKTQNLVKQRPVADCCKGYTKSNSEDRCIPVCSKDCIHGRCVAPDHCLCETGYGGPYCDSICPQCEKHCPLGKFGPTCEQDCNCKNNSSCDPDTGMCHCARGWQGPNCSQPCDNGFYGIKCQQACPKLSIGNKTCDHVTGEYVCSAGYIGITCKEPCPVGTYGMNCKQNCTCKNDGDCHHVTGECQCLPGWIGKNCATPCENGRFGMNCSQHCKCSNGGLCRRNDGVCRCKPGFTGTQCTEICPKGYFGDHCMTPCECKNDNFACHPANGCICSNGFGGDNCDEPVSTGIGRATYRNDQGTSYRITVDITIILALVAAGCIFVYYRRKFSNLKTEIADVRISRTNPGADELLPGIYHRNSSKDSHLYSEPNAIELVSVYDHLDHMRPVNPPKPDYARL